MQGNGEALHGQAGQRQDSLGQYELRIAENTADSACSHLLSLQPPSRPQFHPLHAPKRLQLAPACSHRYQAAAFGVRTVLDCLQKLHGDVIAAAASGGSPAW